MVYDVAEPSTIQTGSNFGDDTRPVILSVDMKALGLAGRLATLTDLLGTETLKVASKDLATGVEIRMRQGDSRLYYLDKRA